MPRAVLDIKRRLEEHQAQSKRSFDSLQGELSKLRVRLSSLATSIVPWSAPSTTTAPPSTTATSAPSVSAITATASVAREMFDEMPTPSFLHGTHAIAPEYENYGYGYPNQIQSSCVQGGRTNLSEQYLDGLPHHYGFDNLNRQSVFLADGTEHSYYALPADYPLELSTPPLSSSAAEIVSVRAPPSVAAGLAPVCCSKTNNTASSETVLVHDVQPPTVVQDDHKVLNEMHVFDVFEDEKQESRQSRKCFRRPSENPFPEVILEFTLTDNVDVSVARSTKFKHGQCIPQVLEYAYTPGCALGEVVKVYKWNMLFSEEGREVWDPGDTKFHSLLTHAASATKLQNTIVVQSLGYMFAIDTSSLSKLAMSYFTNHMLLVLSASCQEITEDCFADQELMASTSSKMAELKWHISTTRTPFILLSSTTYTWDSGVLNILDLMLDEYTMPSNVQFMQRTAELSFLSFKACTQYMTPNGHNSVLQDTSFILQKAAHLSQGNCLCSLYCNSVLNTAYCTERMQWDPGVKISLYNGLNILTIWAATDKQLYCTHIPELEARENAMHYCQMFEKCIGVSSQLYWHEDINLSGISLWLIHFLPT